MSVHNVGGLPHATVMTGGRCGSCMANPCVCHQRVTCAAPLTIQTSGFGSGWSACSRCGRYHATGLCSFVVPAAPPAFATHYHFSSPLSDTDVDRIARRVVEMLKADAVVHRDVKPDNMIRHDEGEG